MTYEPPHLTWQGRAGTAQLDAVPPCSWHQTARPTSPGAAHALWQYPTSPFPEAEEGSEALPAPLGAGISYPAHEDDGVEGSFPDEKQEGPVGIEDFSVHREGTARDGDSCSS